MKRDLLTESVIARVGEGGDRAAVEQARKRNNEIAQLERVDEGKHCEWLWDSAASARSVATSVVDAGREVRSNALYNP